VASSIRCTSGMQRCAESLAGGLTSRERLPVEAPACCCMQFAKTFAHLRCARTDTFPCALSFVLPQPVQNSVHKRFILRSRHRRSANKAHYQSLPRTISGTACTCSIKRTRTHAPTERVPAPQQHCPRLPTSLPARKTSSAPLAAHRSATSPSLRSKSLTGARPSPPWCLVLL
jgi:hypothetical protein